MIGETATRDVSSQHSHEHWMYALHNLLHRNNSCAGLRACFDLTPIRACPYCDMSQKGERKNADLLLHQH